MRRPLLAFCLIVLTYAFASGQCLTDFTKLVPEQATDYASDFGRSFSVVDDILAVGIPANDSLGRIVGIVYMYQRQADNSWKWIASMAPSDPIPALQFGVTVKLSKNYLIVGSSYPGGKVYVFRKNSNWTTATETYQLTVPSSQSFGNGDINGVAISDDELTLAIVDQNMANTSSRTGAIFVYHRQLGDEWIIHAPQKILSPENDVIDFGRTGVYFLGDRLITASPYAPTGWGQAYVYRDPTGEFTNLVLEAKLKSVVDSETTLLGFTGLAVVDEGIMAWTGASSTARTGLAFFEKPASGPWTATEPTCFIDFTSENVYGWVTTIQSNGQIYLGYPTRGGDARVSTVTKGPGGWCDATLKVIDYVTASSSPYASAFGSRLAASGDNLIIGMTNQPGLPNTASALKGLHRNGSTWFGSLIYVDKKTTAGHRYGATVLTYKNNLFVGSPYDGTVKSGGGAVYGYKKVGTSWIKNSKVLIPNPKRYDDVFGYEIATDGNQLVIGAPGFEDSDGSGGGRVFIYNPKNAGWTDWELAQEIDLRSLGLDSYAYSDHIAMTDKWLVVPYIITGTVQQVLSIFKKSGNTWEYFQSLEVGRRFSRDVTFDVDIDGETIVCNQSIIQRNEAGLWEMKYLLSQTNPEPIQISSDFTHWITDGDGFGSSISINGDNIFIGAPTRDYNGTWNVGSVFVYTRKPGYEWSSMTETTQIFPRVKEENGLFGYSIDVLENTLIVGAPGADFNKDGVTARNMPGRAYIIQSLDYGWQNILPLMDFTGDQFTKDYFGLTVALDGDNFIIGAPIEDLPTGKLSGSVYVAPVPPIVRLVPPVCSSLDELDLFAYPFGGTWSGPGITNAAEGIFSPKAIGPGVHTFEYRTPSCTYVGKLMIEILEPPVIVSHSETDLKFCHGATSVSSILSINTTATSVRWYYRQDPDHSFEPLMEFASTMQATKTGDYYPMLYNQGCGMQGPVFSFSEEVVDIVVSEVGELCQGESITLTASPAGGTWTGLDVSGSKFIASVGGVRPVTYRYVSTRSCTYDEIMLIEVLDPPTLTIRKPSGSVCSDEGAQLSVGPVDDNVMVDWMYNVDGTSYSALDLSGSDITVTSNGRYMAVSKIGRCRENSSAFRVDDKLALTFNPPGPVVKVCEGSDQKITATSTGSPDFIWKFSNAASDNFESISNNASVGLTRGGFYQLEATAGECAETSAVFQVEILPADTLIAPNVFTPNGDGKNDKFIVLVGTGSSALKIINRYGEEVFSGSSDLPWDGGNSPAGVYFWIANGRSCEGESKMLKGYVQLVR